MVHSVIEKFYNTVTRRGKDIKAMQMADWNREERKELENYVADTKVGIADSDKRIASLTRKIERKGKTAKIPEIVEVLEFVETDVLKPVDDKHGKDQRKLWTVRNLEHMQLQREAINLGDAYHSRLDAIRALMKQL
jgi:hypothetical protein